MGDPVYWTDGVRRALFPVPAAYRTASVVFSHLSGFPFSTLPGAYAVSLICGSLGRQGHTHALILFKREKRPDALRNVGPAVRFRKVPTLYDPNPNAKPIHPLKTSTLPR